MGAAVTSKVCPGRIETARAVQTLPSSVAPRTVAENPDRGPFPPPAHYAVCPAEPGGPWSDSPTARARSSPTASTASCMLFSRVSSWCWLGAQRGEAFFQLARGFVEPGRRPGRSHRLEFSVDARGQVAAPRSARRIARSAPSVAPAALRRNTRAPPKPPPNASAEPRSARPRICGTAKRSFRKLRRPPRDSESKNQE